MALRYGYNPVPVPQTEVLQLACGNAPCSEAVAKPVAGPVPPTPAASVFMPDVVLS